MKILNFSIDKVIKFKVAEQTFDLHNHFKLEGYNHNTKNRVFELSLKGWISHFSTEVANQVTTDLKIIFRQVKFLNIQDSPFHEDNVCFNRMQFVDEVKDLIPELIEQVENLFTTDEVEPFDWKDCMYIDFTWGVAILISSETVEVKYSQTNSLE